MTETFGILYAASYDALYGDKDYSAEARMLDEMFRSYGGGAVHRIADFGCGTGRHALALASLGYEVIGVDRSEAMLQVARSRAAPSSASLPVFVHGDIRDASVGQNLDAVVAMFAVLSYQTTDADIVAVLRNARRHLRTGGLLVFDIWYGPAVIQVGPESRTKQARAGSEMLTRTATAKLNLEDSTCAVTYDLVKTDALGSETRTTEVHPMRFFFPDELTSLLADAGFDLVLLGGFPEYHRAPDERSWNALVIAAARDPVTPG